MLIWHLAMALSFASLAHAGSGKLLLWESDHLAILDMAGKRSDLNVAVSSMGLSALYIGGNRPKLSPDGAFVAFLGPDGSARVISTEDGAAQVISSPTLRNDPIMSYSVIADWSPNSRHLLFAHVPTFSGQIGDPFNKHFIEFRAYDPHLRSSVLLKGLPNFIGWNADSASVFFETTTVVSVQSTTFTQTSLGVYSMTSQVKKLVVQLSPGLAASNYSFSQDGKKFTAVLSDDNLSYSRVAEISLPEGKISFATERGAWAEYQWPKFSPSGRLLAVCHRIRHGVFDWILIEKGKARTVSTGKSSCPDLWATEDRLASRVMDGQSTVVDVKSGEETVLRASTSQ